MLCVRELIVIVVLMCGFIDLIFMWLFAYNKHANRIYTIVKPLVKIKENLLVDLN